MHDFDFLLGKDWRVTNRALKERFTGCNEWVEFEARLHNAHKILGGHGIIDDFDATRDGKPFHASSIRIFNPATKQWAIYWADSLGFEVLPQVVGSFENGVGTFIGSEVYNGKSVQLRFRWTDISEDSARWEQAYFDERSGDWETNWIMEFRAETTED